MPFQDKLFKLKDFLELWSKSPSPKKLVFTNGVFDLLHLGHVSYLEEAMSLGTHLIVAVNSDKSTRSLEKGVSRPIQDERARALVLAALQSVDFVVVFDDATPSELISKIKPNVLVKGGDYNPDQMDSSQQDYIVGSEEVKQAGGEVFALALIDGYSTSNIEAKIQSNGKN